MRVCRPVAPEDCAEKTKLDSEEESDSAREALDVGGTLDGDEGDDEEEQ